MSSPLRIELSKTILAQLDSLQKWAVVLNGAAAAGILTFLGNTVENKSQFADWYALGTSLLAFAIGVVFAIATNVAVFFSLNYFAQLDEPNLGDIESLRLHIVVEDRGIYSALAAIILYGASSVSFVVGILYGRYAVFG